jgi:hypothetical protein
MQKKKVSARPVRRPDPAQSASTFKGRVRTELGYMTKGAKVLPHVVGQKVKASARAWWEEKKEEGRQMKLAEREARLAEKQAEREAYKEAMVTQARQRGIAKAKKRAAGGGAGGWLQQLGEAGQRMSVAEGIGLDTKGAISAGESAFGYQFQGLPSTKRQRQNGGSIVSNHIFEGLGFGQPQPQPARRIVVHHIHHHKKKRRS